MFAIQILVAVGMGGTGKGLGPTFATLGGIRVVTCDPNYCHLQYMAQRWEDSCTSREGGEAVTAKKLLTEFLRMFIELR